MYQTWLRNNAIPLAFLTSACLLIAFALPMTMFKKASTKDNSQPTKTQTAKTTKHISLANYPLFGEYIPSVQTKDIPSTMLNISLVGVLKGNDPKDSQALIKVGNNDEKLYLVNDNLPGGAILIKILDDAVLLKRNQRIERLALPKDPLNLDAHDPPLKNEGF